MPRSSQQAKPTSVIIPAPPPVTQKHLQGTQDNPLGNSPHPPVTQDDPGDFGGRACITQGGVASGNAGRFGDLPLTNRSSQATNSHAL
ncbi:MAG: hypothetical protein D3907_14725 [Candidatus Electrothrix sp. AUS3]|nr:hypothetical protein [Candidatus Electrothrix gigas]